MALITLNRQASLDQLQSLGYVDGDKVFLRFFFHSDDKRKDGDKGRKLQGVYPDLPWDQIESYQNEGRGCYFVVNGQGDTNDEIKLGKAIFFEHDDLSIEEQKNLWQELGLPQPTLQVNTGGKSIHSYWVLENPISVKDWKQLQKDLVQFSKADKSIINSSRVMRLAGAFYVCNDDQPVETTIYSQSNQKHSYELLRALIPMQAVTKPTKKENKGFEILDTTERELVVSAINAIDPDVDYNEFLSILMSAHSYDESLLDEVIDWATKATLDENQYRTEYEITYKWKGFKGDRGIGVGTIFYYAVQHGFKYPKNLSNELTQWVKAQTKHHLESQQNKSYYKKSTLLDDLEEFDPDQLNAELDKIAKDMNAWQFVQNSFPHKVVENINFFAERTGIKPETYALCFLTAISSVLNGKFSVLCLASTQWYEPLNIFYVIIGEPGTNKSSVPKLMLEYHREQNHQFRKQFAEETKQYKFDMDEYAMNRKDKVLVGELPPDAPIMRFASIGQATMEYLIAVMETQKDKFNTGLLQFQDEFITLMGALNKYNGGGDEVGRLLEIFSGAEVTTNTKSNNSQGTNKGSLSIISTTQPTTWGKIMDKNSQDNGLDDRFLVSLVLEAESKELNHFDEAEPPYNFSDLIREYIDEFAKCEANQVIKIAKSANYIKQAIEKWFKTDPSKLAKPKTYVYRIAGIFAAMRNPQCPEINADDLNAGWKLVCHSQACKDYIGGNKNTTLGEELLRKARELFLKKKELTISNLKQSNRAVFGNLSKQELQEIIQKVYDSGVTGEMATTKQGTLKLVYVEAKAIKTLESSLAIPSQPVEPIRAVEPVVEPQEVTTSRKEVSDQIDKLSENELELVCSQTNQSEVKQLAKVLKKDVPPAIAKKIDDNTEYEVLGLKTGRYHLQTLDGQSNFYLSQSKVTLLETNATNHS